MLTGSKVEGAGEVISELLKARLASIDVEEAGVPVYLTGVTAQGTPTSRRRKTDCVDLNLFHFLEWAAEMGNFFGSDLCVDVGERMLGVEHSVGWFSTHAIRDENDHLRVLPPSFNLRSVIGNIVVGDIGATRVKDAEAASGIANGYVCVCASVWGRIGEVQGRRWQNISGRGTHFGGGWAYRGGGAEPPKSQISGK